MDRLRFIFGLFAWLLALLFAGGAAAQTSALLPDRFGEWTAQGAATVDQGVQNFPKDTYLNSGILRETGLKRIETRSYRNGSEVVSVRAFELLDPSSAYEWYTYTLAPGMHELGVGADSAAGAQDQRFLVGNLVVLVGPAAIKPESLTALWVALKPKADVSPLPPVKSYLPEKGRVFGSEKYALGPEAFRAALASVDQAALAAWDKEVGFANSAEAMVAKYRSEHGSGTLLLLEYPTPQLAERHLHHLEQALPEVAKDAGASIERKASVLAVTLAPSSSRFAQELRDHVNYETQVTWNEPRQTATDPPWVVILSKIFLFTGAFLGVATGLGLAFGGIRVLTKRFFPGKVFDRPESIEVLQMGLSGKKIDPSDMY